MLASSGRDNRTILWRLPDGTGQVVVAAFTFVAFSPESKRLATSAVRELAVWDCRTYRRLGTTSESDGGRVAYTPDGRAIATVGGSIRLWWATSLRPLPTRS